MRLPTKELTSDIVKFVSRWTATTTYNYSPSQIEYYLTKNVKLALATDLRVLFTMNMMSEYYHPSTDIQNEVRSNIAKMPGSWEEILMKLLRYIPYGYSLSEKSYKINNGKAEISRINTLDINRIIPVFDSTGVITDIEYLEGNGDRVKLKYPFQTLHLKHQSHLQQANNWNGISAVSRAIPYCELEDAMVLALAIAGTRQSVPLLIAKTNINEQVEIYDDNGVPLKDFQGRNITIPKGSKLLKDVKELENGSVLVVGMMDEIEALVQQADPNFFRFIFDYLDSMKMWSLLVPSLLVGIGESGSGDSNLAKTHMKTFFISTTNEAKIFGNYLIENLIKPMLEFNYPGLENFGSFPVKKDIPDNAFELTRALIDLVDSEVLTKEEIKDKVMQITGI